jgi:hypothetical protein
MLIVTTHFDFLNSSEANSVIIFARAMVAITVAGGDAPHQLPPCWCGSSAYQVGPAPTRIGSFFNLDTLAQEFQALGRREPSNGLELRLDSHRHRDLLFVS